MRETHDSAARLHYLFPVGRSSDGARMNEIDARDRQALGLLSETVTAELGPASVVAREVNRAYRSGRTADLRTASAAFDALPAWQRSRIGAARSLIDTLYAPRDLSADLDVDTVVCRCEEVTAGGIRQAVAAGAHGPTRTRAAARCGMGACQGRQCALPVSALFALHHARGPGDIGHYRLRPPAEPVAEAAAKRIFSLPMYHGLTDAQQARVIEVLIGLLKDIS